MREAWQVYQTIKKFSPECCGQYSDTNKCQEYTWADDFLQYNSKYDGYKVNALECKEYVVGKKMRKYVWITNLDIDCNNFKEISTGGRLRWKIENEGFNMQKNGGYNLDSLC